MGVQPNLITSFDVPGDEVIARVIVKNVVKLSGITRAGRCTLRRYYQIHQEWTGETINSRETTTDHKNSGKVTWEGDIAVRRSQHL